MRKCLSPMIILMVIGGLLLVSLSCGNNRSHVDKKDSDYRLYPIVQYCGEHEFANMRYGYINDKGEIVVKPQYRLADEFGSREFRISDELTPILDSNWKYGYINKRGIIVIPPQFPQAFFFTENGLASVGYGTDLYDSKYGFIDRNGKIVINPQFDFVVGGFIEGLAPVAIGKVNEYNFFKSTAKFGYIDKTGEIVIEMKYRFAMPFSEGLACVVFNMNEDEIMDIGFIDKDGKTLFRVQNVVDRYLFFSEGLVCIPIQGKDGVRKYGYCDNTGEFVIKPIFSEADNFSEGLARVAIGGYYGFINKKGEYVINPQYKEACSYSEGLAFVKEEDRCGFINKLGNYEILLDPAYDCSSGFSGGLAHLDYYDLKEGTKHRSGDCYINKKGKIVYYYDRREYDEMEWVIDTSIIDNNIPEDYIPVEE